ncbi:TPA: DUF551 domain-containing protein [Enterobacter roggenkampii]
MSTIAREFTKEQLQQIEAAAKEVLWPVVWSEKKAREHFSEKITAKVVLKLARIALASLEAEPYGYVHKSAYEQAGSCGLSSDHEAYRDSSTHIAVYTAPPAPEKAEPVAWLWSHRKHPSEVTLVRPEDDERAEGAHWSGWSCQALYAAPPVSVSVPEPIKRNDADGWWMYKGRRVGGGCAEWYNLALDDCRAAMLQGAEPVTTKDDGGRYEQDDSPECGWVVTHSGKDYFYREQKDAVTHMNSAVESGLGVSLRSFIPEPVTTANKLPDGWVACSERMPERMVDVITSNGVDTGKGWWDGDNWKEWHKYDAVPGKITHWMPMPEAPQQEA